MNKYILTAAIGALVGCSNSQNGEMIEQNPNRDEENLLTSVLQKHSATPEERGWAIVLRNGEITAMSKVGVSNYVDATKFCYEPGSVIKPITAILALESGVIGSLQDEICTDINEKGYDKLPGDGPHVWPEKMKVADAIVKSSNIVIGKMACKVGAERLHDGLESFGFGGDSGFLPSKAKLNSGSISRVGIGQFLLVTPLQIAQAYSILANHGRKFGAAASQVVKAEVADAVYSELKRVCTDEGTARKAAIDGFMVAGKTGTSQRVVAGKYAEGCFNATFVGMVDGYVIVVVYECINGSSHQGGQRPAEAFREIATNLLAQ